MRQRLVALLGLASLATGFELVINPKKAQDSGGGNTMAVDISKLRNNRGFGMSPGDADFDGSNFAYPAQFLPNEHLVYNGVNYNFPQYQPGKGSDNVLAQGQMLDVPKGRYIGVHMLAAAEGAIATGFVNATYEDGSTSSGQVLVDPFWAWPYPYGGDIIFPYLMTDTAINYNRTMIFQTVNWLDSTKELTSLQLPNVTVGTGNGRGGASEQTRLHIFAVSMIPAKGHGLALDVQYARSTNMWFEGTNKTQIVEATINNVGTEWILAKNGVKVIVESVEQDNLRTAGQWIKTHAEAIFNTTYWYITPEEGKAVRFTQTADAFYMSTLSAPNATLTLRSPVPYVSGDKVTIEGGKMAGHVVPSKQLGDGSLQLSISEENADEYAWVFKIDFGGPRA
ncbi:hypothetical protein V501_01083 [Pseudogymnoascus sp. VKM F-4519 (FW-2642)]|nr:hypothetical protein V501_01083 [Pseudogymnoascus sp. VKM F-4519 (FW-2642)]